MAKCPTCGQEVKRRLIQCGSELQDVMRQHNTCCYQGRDGRYYLEYGYGEVTRGAIDAALSAELIQPKWDDAPHLEYWRAKI